LKDYIRTRALAWEGAASQGGDEVLQPPNPT
jgi:hypothetical protein